MKGTNMYRALMILLLTVPAMARSREVKTCNTNLFGTVHCVTKVDGRIVERETCSTNRFGTTRCVRSR